jgi:putative membrane protein
MDFATRDMGLAIAHHALVFALAGVLAFELGAVRPGMKQSEIVRVAKVDLWYGVLAAAIIIVGFTRANVAAKGWDYYAHNGFFWAKIATFALVGVLSIIPTLGFIRWRRAGSNDASFIPSDRDITNVKRFLWAEAVLFLLIPVFAALMARGYGAY